FRGVAERGGPNRGAELPALSDGSKTGNARAGEIRRSRLRGCERHCDHHKIFCGSAARYRHAVYARYLFAACIAIELTRNIASVFWENTARLPTMSCWKEPGRTMRRPCRRFRVRP